jgi:hypothetical protein
LLVKKHNKSIKSKVIEPSDRLIDYLNETLKLEEYKSNPKLKQKLGTKMARKIRSNDEKKVRTMDYLFRSMADLIYFFKFVNNNPELIDRFDDDILDLLGLRTEPKFELRWKEDPPTISRFIQQLICTPSFCGYGEVMAGEDYGKLKFAYRYHVLSIMQRHVMDKAMPVYSEPSGAWYKAKTESEEKYATEYTNEENRKAIYDKFFISKQIVDKLDKFWVSSKLDAMFPKRSIIP